VFKKALITTITIVYLLTTSACGVILYPERQGQSQGKIDLTVAFFDGLGLLIWVIPGLVAFAVDFHQGTIYLPNSQAAIDKGEGPYRELKIEGELSKESVEAALEQELGYAIDLSDERAQLSFLEGPSQDAIPALAYNTRGVTSL